MILVVGGTGRLGQSTARMLLKRGERVRIMTRTPEKARELLQLGAEVVPGDLTLRSSLENACRGVNTVFDAAQSLVGRGIASFERVDGAGKRTLIDAAGHAGVQHFVFISVRGASPHHPVAFCRVKYAVEQHLQASGLRFTILRPTAFYDPQAARIGEPLLRKGKTVLLGRGNNPRNFMAAEDAAQFAVCALFDPQAGNEIIELGGPANLTNNQVAELYARIAGIEAQVTHIPLAVVRLMALLAQPLHPGVANVLHWAVYSDTVDGAFDLAPLLLRYPLSLTRLEDWVRGRIERGSAGAPS